MAQREYKPFQFVIPTLPVETYRFVQRVSKAYNLTYWQVVVCALDHLETLGTQDKAQVEALFAKAKGEGTKPDPWA